MPDLSLLEYAILLVLAALFVWPARGLELFGAAGRRVYGRRHQRTSTPGPAATSRARFCTQCGAPAAGGRFCTQCGAMRP
jgi:hypothetical protein